MTAEARAFVSVYVTAPDTRVAERIGRALVEERLAACVNVLPGMVSLYRWEGALQRDDEALLFAKTVDARVEALLERVAELHPYEVPCALVLPVVGGLGPYLHWVGEQVADPAG